MVLLPLILLVLTALQLRWAEILQIISSQRVIASLILSFEMAAIATLINVIFGFLLAWSLVRYDFPGKNIINALVDLPFALPTAVAGIALASLYAPSGLLGQWLNYLEIQLAYGLSHFISLDIVRKIIIFICYFFNLWKICLTDRTTFTFYI